MFDSFNDVLAVFLFIIVENNCYIKALLDNRTDKLETIELLESINATEWKEW